MVHLILLTNAPSIYIFILLPVDLWVIPGWWWWFSVVNIAAVNMFNILSSHAYLFLEMEFLGL